MMQQQNSAPPRRFRGRIGFTLILAFVLLALVPVVIVSLAAVDKFDKQAHNEIVNQLESVADIKTDEINEFLDSQQTLLAVLLANPAQHTNVVNTLTAAQSTASEPLLSSLQAHLKAQDDF